MTNHRSDLAGISRRDADQRGSDKSKMHVLLDSFARTLPSDVHLRVAQDVRSSLSHRPILVKDSVLIVGASSDIALALARAWAAAGRSLVLTSRMPKRLERDVEDLRARYKIAIDVREFDILDTATAEKLLDELPELPGTVAIAVGMLGNQTRSAADVAEAEQVMRTNFLGPALFLGQVANRMERRGSGTIIGISSVAGDRGRASNYVYGAAKAGFTAFLSGLRNRLAARGVHVLTVKPGFVATRMTEGMRMPGLLTAQPDEVARAILRAEAKRRNTIYVRTVWRPVMTIIWLLPESLFKKMAL